MLGRLIAWLRICGYDTMSALDCPPATGEDARLIAAAAAGGRILVSRDRELVGRAEKAGVEAVLVGDDDVREQLKSLMAGYGLKIDPEMTRCTACNAALREASAEDLEKLRTSGAVPGHILGEKALWVCGKCGKAYWQGSHWRNILRTAEEVRGSGKQ